MSATASLKRVLLASGGANHRNTTKLFGNPLRAFATTLFRKLYRGTRLIAVPNGNNAKDWAIRSQAPKPVTQGYGEGSETR